VFVQRDFVTLTELRPTTLKFEHNEINFGILGLGKPQTGTFIFTNNGNNPLIITNAEASCGCTTPEWPKYPIKPGKNGGIKITSDAKFPGLFIKTVKQSCNTEGGIMNWPSRVRCHRENDLKSLTVQPYPVG